MAAKVNTESPEAKDEKAASREKKRAWWIIVYPESAPKDWREVLEQTGLQVAVSPLHDEDIDAEGTVKKPHWHVIVAYDGPTTYSNVKKLADKLNAPIPKPIERLAGAFKYLTHKDSSDPKKHDYTNRADEIVLMNGFDPDEIDAKQNLNVTIHRELRRYAYENGITSLHDLEEYADERFGDAGVQYVDRKTYYIRSMLQDVEKYQKKGSRSDSFDYDERVNQRFKALESQMQMLSNLLVSKFGFDPNTGEYLEGESENGISER